MLPSIPVTNQINIGEDQGCIDPLMRSLVFQPISTFCDGADDGQDMVEIQPWQADDKDLSIEIDLIDKEKQYLGVSALPENNFEQRAQSGGRQTSLRMSVTNSMQQK